MASRRYVSWQAEQACGIARASFRAVGLSEQAPSFEVVSIVVRRAIRTEAIGFFRVETCLRETYQLAGQNQEAAVGKFPRADIELD